MTLLNAAILLASPVPAIGPFDPQKHFDPTFYDCDVYAREDFAAADISKNMDQSTRQKMGILVWFEFDESSERTSAEDIRWKHSVTAPINLYNDSDRSSSLSTINELNWVISTLSDGHIEGYTHWDKINLYHQVRDKPLALVTIIQEEMGDSDNGIAKIELVRVHHAKCDVFDNENALKLFQEFAL